MAVDYRKQYTPDQLEPFWPNELLRMFVVVLCTLAVIMALVVLPVVLDRMGLGHLVHEQQPADPRETPQHIRPEWYFLAVYQYLKLPPSEFLGMSGKTIGVLSQAPFMLVVLLVPFWGRPWSRTRPGPVHKTVVTAVILASIALTFWPLVWDETAGAFVPPPLLFTLFFTVAVVLFYLFIWDETRTIRKVLRHPGEGSR